MNSCDYVKCKKDFLSHITDSVIFKKDEYYIVDYINEKSSNVSIYRRDCDAKMYFDLVDNSGK